MEANEHWGNTVTAVDYRAELRRDRTGVRWTVDLDLAYQVTQAGTASFESDEFNLVCDYARPERIIRIEIPFGSFSDDRPSEANAFERGEGFSEASRRIAEWVLGEGLTEALSVSNVPVLRGSIEPRPAWETVGRFAVLETHLSETAIPIEGFWALEWLALAGASRLDGLVDTERLGEVARAAVPILRHVPINWLQTLDERVFSSIRAGIVRANRAEPTAEASPLSEELRKLDQVGLLDELERLPREPNRVSISGNSTEAGPGGDTFLGAMGTTTGRQDVGEASDVSTSIDEMSSGAVESAGARVVGNELHVWAVPEPGFEDLSVHLEVRVYSPVGLLASSSGMAAPGSSNRAEVILTLPPEMDSDVSVVLGFDLPQAVAGRREFDAGRRAFVVRRLLDAERQQDSARVRELLELTADVELIDVSVGPFTPDFMVAGGPELTVLRDRVVQERPNDETARADSERVLRHLAQLLGQADTSAEHHLAAVAATSNDYSERELFALAWEACESGETEMAGRLMELIRED